MRRIIPERESELLEIINPYMVHVPGPHGPKLREDAPEEVKKAYEEFMKITEEERNHRYDPDWF